MARYYKFRRFGRSRFAHLRIQRVVFFCSLISCLFGILLGSISIALVDGFIWYLIRVYS